MKAKTVFLIGTGFLPVVLLAILLLTVIACGGSGGKDNQVISFGHLAPQSMSSGSVTLQATASSNLPVSFTVQDNAIARLEGNRAVFLMPGTTTVTAAQAGNERYNEAPNVTRTLTIILDQDPNKKDQTIDFSLPTTWTSEMGLLDLAATATSGLPVTFTCSDPDVGEITGFNQLFLIYGDYKNYPLVITASQVGDDEYNPAPNVSKTVFVEHIH